MNEANLQLTDSERAILAMYRDSSNSGMGRAVRLSIQYGIGGAIFLYLAISTGNPWWSAAVYGLFVAWMGVRLLGARTLANVIPAIIKKYEKRIEELEQQLGSS